jgi:hypothetical protein
MTRVIRMRRGPVAVAFEVLFYLFNALMLLGLVSVSIGADRVVEKATERGASAAGLGGIAGTLATILVLFTWMAGNVILATLVLVARRRAITIEEKD